MNKTKHTSGPWIVRDWNPTGQKTVEVIRDGLRSKLAILHPSHLCDEHGGSLDANARLIAAAPDLLAALKSAYSTLSQPVHFTDSAGAAPASILRGDAEVARMVIAAALAKAQGQEGGAE
jgi:hypothetical protein